MNILYDVKLTFVKGLCEHTLHKYVSLAWQPYQERNYGPAGGVGNDGDVSAAEHKTNIVGVADDLFRLSHTALWCWMSAGLNNELSTDRQPA